MGEEGEAVYEPGSAVAVAGPASWMVVDIAPDHAVVGACWSAVRAGAPVEAVLDALAAGGLGSAPDFALAQRQHGSWRVVVRGAGVAAVAVEGGFAHTVRAPAGTTWTDTIVVGGVEELELSLDPDAPRGSVVLPLTSGVLIAGRLRLSMRAAEQVPPQVPAPVVAATAVPVAVPLVEEEVEEEVGEGTSYDHLFGATARPDEPAETTPPPTPATSPSMEGRTLLPPLEQAPLEPPAPPAAPMPAAPAQVVPAPVMVAVPDGLIASFPFAVGGHADAPVPVERPAEVPPTHTPPAVQNPVEDSQAIFMTVDRTALRRDAAAVGPSVLAARCPAGHLSPANASLCRVCRVPVPPQQPVEAPRPVLGALRLSTGDVVTLDRGVVLGRAPESGDGERPHLVKLTSPSGDISRVHLEVVLEGWHVLVRDLGSTNGSTVAAPGEAPVRVRAHELVALEPGAEVSLADEVSFSFEVTP